MRKVKAPMPMNAECAFYCFPCKSVYAFLLNNSLIWCDVIMEFSFAHQWKGRVFDNDNQDDNDNNGVAVKR